MRGMLMCAKRLRIGDTFREVDQKNCLTGWCGSNTFTVTDIDSANVRGQSDDGVTTISIPNTLMVVLWNEEPKGELVRASELVVGDRFNKVNVAWPETENIWAVVSVRKYHVEYVHQDKDGNVGCVRFSIEKSCVVNKSIKE